jgi:hypothetical protein
MSPRKARALPGSLEKVQRRFERWRQTRKIPARIPGPLWASAVRMARAYGIADTAKTLRVNDAALKKRMEHEAVVSPSFSKESRGATFLELAPPTRASFCQCTLELENASGAKMRIHLQGDETPDLAALSRSFWNPGP